MKKYLLIFEMVPIEKQRFKKVNFYGYIQVNLLQGMKFYPAKRGEQNSWNVKETLISSSLTYLSMTLYNFKCCREDTAWQRCSCLATPSCVQES